MHLQNFVLTGRPKVGPSRILPLLVQQSLRLALTFSFLGRPCLSSTQQYHFWDLLNCEWQPRLRFFFKQRSVHEVGITAGMTCSVKAIVSWLAALHVYTAQVIMEFYGYAWKTGSNHWITFTLPPCNDIYSMLLTFSFDQNWSAILGHYKCFNSIIQILWNIARLWSIC